jgi:hypothetical protein
MLGNSLVAAQLTASQEELSSMELVSLAGQRWILFLVILRQQLDYIAANCRMIDE